MGPREMCATPRGTEMASAGVARDAAVMGSSLSWAQRRIYLYIYVGWKSGRKMYKAIIYSALTPCIWKLSIMSADYAISG